MIDKASLRRDATAENIRISSEYMWRIMRRARAFGTICAHELYHDAGMLDIPMYLALARLVNRGDLRGPHPYAWDCPNSHRMMLYVYVPQPLNSMEAAATGGL